jgi:hypothetical protein
LDQAREYCIDFALRACVEHEELHP